MSNTVVNRIIENGSRNLITEHVLLSSTGTSADNEGTLVAPVSKLATPFSGANPSPVPTNHWKVRRIVYSLSPNLSVAIIWVATTTSTLLAVLAGWGEMCLEDTQGIINDSVGPTDVGFFTQMPAAASGAFPTTGSYTVVLEFIRGQ